MLTPRRRSLLARYIGVLLLTPAIAMFGSGCASPNRTETAPENLQETLDTLAERYRVCAIAVAVIKDRKLDSIASATGCSPRSALNPDSVFQAASLSKPVFAYAVLTLVAQGKMSLDAPVMTYLPQGYRHQFNPGKPGLSAPVSDPRLQGVTVRMVLNHTSGLPNWAYGPLDFESTPGTEWRYSGEGYVLLQRAVEAVTGEPLDQFMASQVFKPLAMNSSGYAWNERLAKTLLPGTKANGMPRATMDLKTPNAAFSLFIAAPDYGKFLVTLLNNEHLLEQITAAPVKVDPALGLSWGLGWGIEDTGSDRYIWQWGNITGYRAFAIASLRTGDGFVMLSNSENGLELAKPIAAQVLPGEHKLFESPILGWDVINFFCNTLRVCL